MPGGALALLQANAMEAWRKQDFPQYFRLMEKACRENPSNPGPLLDMGVAHGMRFDYAAAEKCFERAIRVAPNKEEILIMAGTQCRGFDRYDMARAYFERAVKSSRATADTCVKLAEIYERFHLLEEARDLIDRALKQDPNCILAILAQARLKRSMSEPEEAEKILRPLLALTGEATWSTRVRGWYELGAILDAQHRYGEAMTAFMEAKTMILPNAGKFIASQKAVQARLKITEEKLNPEMVRRWRNQTSLGPPQRLALLCGHPRSGTTLLEQVLDSHPEMVSAEETTIFLRETFTPLLRGAKPESTMLDIIEPATADALRHSRQNYKACMTRFLKHAPEARLLVDKNPSLTGLVPAFVRVFPEVKLLVALRDPRDVCLSCFMQPLPLGQASSIFLDLETTAQEYASVMGLWRAMSAAMDNAFIEVRYEDLVADLAGTARRVLEYLGVAWDERVLRYNEHAQKKVVRSPTYAAVAKPISRGAIGRWRHYEKHLAPHLEILAPFAKAFGYE